MNQYQLNKQLFYNIEAFKKAIEDGANVNAMDEDGETPLHWIARCGCTEMAKMLIEAGADVNARDEDGNTPLHNASLWGHTETSRVLIEKGADVNATNKYGRTPLHRVAPGLEEAVKEAQAYFNNTEV